MSPAPVLQAQDLWFGYAREAPVLRGINLKLGPGAFTALLGQNGSGKTTLAKQFVGLLRPASGVVLMDGQDIAERSIGELARTVGYVFQNPDHQLFSTTVEQELELGPRNQGLPEDEVRARAERAAVEFELTPWLDRRVGTLSFGQRKALSVAAIAAMHPAVLVLDEPTSGLHWQAAQALLDRLAERSRLGHTILLITHDMRLVAEYASQAVLMLEGQVAASGAPYEIFQQSELLQRARIEPPQIVQLARRLSLSAEVLTVPAACEAYLAAHG